ncbi:MAG: protein-L-isoaspartate(D-aspartate) O-methyltransferase [Myxococcales bacterium]|nr:protein-L-isoaspartate(D-aspartate) O-methyltransferase [Myxococcales bacterium]MCB9736567.1 protein-L-isoaspartate(D-aspartate) O-methyltransferase [Deltaproteobacteria bacterium]
MVRTQLEARGVRDPRVLEAFGRVPRHLFVPEALRDAAYEDHPVAIGHGQTISQPYIVALMTELAGPREGERALDVGTGSGYQAAILAELCDTVVAIEVLPALAALAARRLEALRYDNVTVRVGDAWVGAPEHAPYDVIIAAAAPAEVPPALLEQLAVGGRLVIPLGVAAQELVLFSRERGSRLRRETITGVRFVPMVGGRPRG